jgi:hypothetical protein
VHHPVPRLHKNLHFGVTMNCPFLFLVVPSFKDAARHLKALLAQNNDNKAANIKNEKEKKQERSRW